MKKHVKSQKLNEKGRIAKLYIYNTNLGLLLDIEEVLESFSRCRQRAQQVNMHMTESPIWNRNWNNRSGVY